MTALVLSLDAASRNSLARAVADQIRTVAHLLTTEQARPRPLEQALSDVPTEFEARYVAERDRLSGLLSKLTAVANTANALARGDAVYFVGASETVYKVESVHPDGLQAGVVRFGDLSEAVISLYLPRDAVNLRRAIGAAYEPRG